MLFLSQIQNSIVWADLSAVLCADLSEVSLTKKNLLCTFTTCFCATKEKTAEKSAKELHTNRHAFVNSVSCLSVLSHFSVQFLMSICFESQSVLHESSFNMKIKNPYKNIILKLDIKVKAYKHICYLNKKCVVVICH